MRRSHITYLSQMVESITTPPAPEGGFGSRFLEIHPPLDQVVQNLPCAVIVGVQVRNSMPDKTKMDYLQLENRTERDGTVTDRRLRRHLLQEYRYRIQFYYGAPEPELLSDEDLRSVIDQCLIFITENQAFVTDQRAKARVVAGDAGLDTSMADEGIYASHLDVMIADSLWSVGETNRQPIRSVKIRTTEVEQNEDQ